MLAEMFFADDERRAATPLCASCEAPARDSVVDSVTLPTANLARAVNFYARAFGFHLVTPSTSGRRPRRVVLHAARTRLALEEHGADRSAAGQRVRLAVGDFDAARERVWDLGIAAAQDAGTLGDGEPPRGRRRFVVRDPDGHEIEVVDRRAH